MAIFPALHSFHRPVRCWAHNVQLKQGLRGTVGYTDNLWLRLDKRRWITIVDATQYFHLNAVHTFSLDKVDLVSGSSVLDVPSVFSEDDVITFLDDASHTQDRTLHGQVDELGIHLVAVKSAP